MSILTRSLQSRTLLKVSSRWVVTLIHSTTYWLQRRHNVWRLKHCSNTCSPTSLVQVILIIWLNHQILQWKLGLHCWSWWYFRDYLNWLLRASSSYFCQLSSSVNFSDPKQQLRAVLLYTCCFRGIFHNIQSGKSHRVLI